MDIIQRFVPADGVHIGVEALIGAKAVAVQRQPLPFGQRMDHLCIPADIGDVKGDGALHTVQIIVQAGGRFHKKRRRDTTEVQIAAEGILEHTLDKADGFLGIVKGKTTAIALWDKNPTHNFRTPLQQKYTCKYRTAARICQHKNDTFHMYNLQNRLAGRAVPKGTAPAATGCRAALCAAALRAVFRLKGKLFYRAFCDR